MSEPLITMRELEREMNHRTERLMQAEERIERLELARDALTMALRQAEKQADGFSSRTAELEASDALRATLIRDVLHRFSLDEEEYYGSGGFSLLGVIDQLHADYAAKYERIAELEAERDALKAGNTSLRKLYTHLVKRVRDEYGIEIGMQWEQRVLNGEHDVPLPESGIYSENAALRKALDDAPHIDGCRSALVICANCSEVKPMHSGSMRYCRNKNDTSAWKPINSPCNCWKANLPEAPK